MSGQLQAAHSVGWWDLGGPAMWMTGTEGGEVMVVVGWLEGTCVETGGWNHPGAVAVTSIAVLFRSKLQSELLVLLNLARYRLVLAGGDGRE
jgi:hypothetical protein